MPLTQRTAILVLFLIVGTLFFPTLQGSFLSTWDDGSNITENPEIRSLEPENLLRVFTSFRGNLYKPLVTLSYAVEHAFAGPDARLFHATNLLLHALNTVLAFLLMRRLGAGLWAAALASLLWGIHPMKVESVAWLSLRKDLLFSAFYLGGLLFYEKGRRKSALACMAAACLSKAVALTFPLVLLLMDRFQGKRTGRKELLAMTPFFAVSVLTAFLGVAAGAVKENAAELGVNFVRAGHALFYYLWKLLAPLGLSPFHPEPNALTPWLAASALGGLLLLGAWGVLSKKNPTLFFGGAFFLAALAPNIQLVPSVGDSLVVDHYTYLPSFGFFFILAGALGTLSEKRRALLLSAAVLWGLWLAGLTWRYEPVWLNNTSLWSRVLQVYPGTETAYFNRANGLAAAGLREEALADYDAALKLDARDKDVWINRGNLLAEMGQANEAERSFLQALAIDPASAQARNNLGQIRLGAGRTQEAVEEFLKAAQADPALWEAHANLGLIRMKQGAFGPAAEHFEAALAQNPASGPLHLHAAAAYRAAGYPEKEQEQLRRARQYGAG